MCVIECSKSKSMYVYVLIANSLLITSHDFHFFLKKQNLLENNLGASNLQKLN